MDSSQATADARLLARNLGRLPEPEAQPAFIVVSGLPGTGKSYFCQQLAERLPCLVLESDALRKQLFPVPTYSVSESSRLFQTIHQLIEELLSKGIPVVLDATNLSERYRERLYSIAENLNAKLILVRVEAPPDVVRERLDSRLMQTGIKGNSDADWTVYQQMKPTAEKIRRNHYAVDTSRDITPVLNKIVREASR
jgi:predicted kinase